MGPRYIFKTRYIRCKCCMEQRSYIGILSRRGSGGPAAPRSSSAGMTQAKKRKRDQKFKTAASSAPPKKAHKPNVWQDWSPITSAIFCRSRCFSHRFWCTYAGISRTFENHNDSKRGVLCCLSNVSYFLR